MPRSCIAIPTGTAAGIGLGMSLFLALTWAGGCRANHGPRVAGYADLRDRPRPGQY